MREREEAIRYANESLMKRLVPVLDNFDMAMAAGAQSPGETARVPADRGRDDSSAVA